MRIGVVGINHKLADLKLREMLAKACQRRFGLGQTTQNNHTFVLLSTCNRTEVYFSSEDLAFTHTYLLSILRHEVEQEFDQKLYSYFGQDCFLHLSRVTAGLDSAIIAETEIQGQVKSAYENAVKYTTLPSEIHYLFQKSLTIGKKVRSKLQMRRGLPDLEDAILNTGTHMFAEPQKAKILFVGASEINLKVIGFLKEKQFPDITLCNRSLNHAQLVAEQYQLNIMNWDNLQTWHNYDWIIFGTKSPEYVINEHHLPSENISRKLVIDLCVPRNVEPKVGRHPNVTLLNIDQIINKNLRIRTQRMIHSVTLAEELIGTAVQLHSDLFLTKEKSRQRFLAISA